MNLGIQWRGSDLRAVLIEAMSIAFNLHSEFRT